MDVEDTEANRFPLTHQSNYVIARTNSENVTVPMDVEESVHMEVDDQNINVECNKDSSHHRVTRSQSKAFFSQSSELVTFDLPERMDLDPIDHLDDPQGYMDHRMDDSPSDHMDDGPSEPMDVDPNDHMDDPSGYMDNDDDDDPPDEEFYFNHEINYDTWSDPQHPKYDEYVRIMRQFDGGGPEDWSNPQHSKHNDYIKFMKQIASGGPVDQRLILMDPVGNLTRTPLYEDKGFELSPDLVDRFNNLHANTTYVIKHIFTNPILVKFQLSYRLAVYQHRKMGAKQQRAAVMGVVFHDMDHAHSTVEQKYYYHRFCGSNPRCDFVNHMKDPNNIPETYTKTTSRRLGSTTSWWGGVWAGLDSKYPVAFEEFIGIVDGLCNLDLMTRCKYLTSTNTNESMHSKLYRICAKTKRVGYARLVFACQHLILVTNFGHVKGSFLKCLGLQGKLANANLRSDDLEADRVAKRTYLYPRTYAAVARKSDTGQVVFHASHRLKRKFNPFEQPPSPPPHIADQPLQIQRHRQRNTAIKATMRSSRQNTTDTTTQSNANLISNKRGTSNLRFNKRGTTNLRSNKRGTTSQRSHRRSHRRGGGHQNERPKLYRRVKRPKPPKESESESESELELDIESERESESESEGYNIFKSGVYGQDEDNSSSSSSSF